VTSPARDIPSFVPHLTKRFLSSIGPRRKGLKTRALARVAASRPSAIGAGTVLPYGSVGA
jgi:hypothetical protein